MAADPVDRAAHSGIAMESAAFELPRKRHDCCTYISGAEYLEEEIETMRTEQPRGVAAELLAYLCSHPSAADTLEGIMNWWLPRQRYETERRRIGCALDQLAAQGFVAKHRLPDGTIVYARSESASGRDGTGSSH